MLDLIKKHPIIAFNVLLIATLCYGMAKVLVVLSAFQV